MPTDLFDTEDCDDSGATDHVLRAPPLPAIRPLSDWLGDLARVLGVGDVETSPTCLAVPRTSKAAVAAPMT